MRWAPCRPGPTPRWVFRRGLTACGRGRGNLLNIPQLTQPEKWFAPRRPISLEARPVAPNIPNMRFRPGSWRLQPLPRPLPHTAHPRHVAPGRNCRSTGRLARPTPPTHTRVARCGGRFQRGSLLENSNARERLLPATLAARTSLARAAANHSRCAGGTRGRLPRARRRAPAHGRRRNVPPHWRTPLGSLSLDAGPRRLPPLPFTRPTRCRHAGPGPGAYRHGPQPRAAATPRPIAGACPTGRETRGPAATGRNRAFAKRHACIELWPEACVSGRRLLEQLAAPARACPAESSRRQPSAKYPLQACLRDIWHDHVFFKGDGCQRAGRLWRLARGMPRWRCRPPARQPGWRRRRAPLRRAGGLRKCAAAERRAIARSLGCSIAAPRFWAG